MSRGELHIPVLLKPVLDVIDPRPGQTIVDCTLGLGGHSCELLKRIAPGGRLIAIDFDPANMAIARPKLEAIVAKRAEQNQAVRFDLFHNNFAALPTVLREASVERVDAVLADVGVASTQIDDPARGFSYRRDGPLDMRMDPTRGRPASELVNKLGQREIAEALREYGDEEDADEIARLIVDRRKAAPILTTAQLTKIVCDARDFTLQRAAGAKLHPAARTFQALRILVNRELANLERLLAVLPDVLKPGGVAAIITFHSGEDRRVKLGMKTSLEVGHFGTIGDIPIVADEAEQRSNPRARSAKLRWARRA